MSVIYDKSFPSNQQTLGTHVGVLSGLDGIEGSPFTLPLPTSVYNDRYKRRSSVPLVPFSDDYKESGAADDFGDIGDFADLIQTAPTQPTHRLTVRMHGPPRPAAYSIWSGGPPLSDEQLMLVRRAIESGSDNKIKTYGSSEMSGAFKSPTAPTIWNYSVNVSLHGISVADAKTVLMRKLAIEQSLRDSGLTVVEASLTELGKFLNRALGSLLGPLKWPLIAAGVGGALYLAWPLIMKKRRAMARRSRRK